MKNPPIYAAVAAEFGFDPLSYTYEPQVLFSPPKRKPRAAKAKRAPAKRATKATT